VGIGDRQAWQLAAAATGPDEGLAQRLRSIAADAFARHRIETAAAAWQRAAELSADPQTAAELLLQAVGVILWTGQVDRVTSFASRALQLTDEPAVSGRARAALGWALSLTIQYDKTVALMCDLATELAGKDDSAQWSAMSPAATAAYYSGEDALWSLGCRSRWRPRRWWPTTRDRRSSFGIRPKPSRPCLMAERRSTGCAGWWPTTGGRHTIARPCSG
jgi:hypothetical protein